LFIQTPVTKNFGILESGFNNLRVAINIEAKKSQSGVPTFTTVIEAYDDIRMVIVEKDELGATTRTSKISSSMSLNVSNFLQKNTQKKLKQ
jgi:hypothetical protein